MSIADSVYKNMCQVVVVSLKLVIRAATEQDGKHSLSFGLGRYNLKNW